MEKNKDMPYIIEEPDLNRANNLAEAGYFLKAYSETRGYILVRRARG